MRRLLAFGTGAAIIGLVLLLVAFYESYIIVSQLQREIEQQGTTDVNLLLEDATLEAIFLGVMVALGYGLVSQGFNGIRRQELLDLEGSADDEMTKARVMAKIERERAAEKVRPRGLRMPTMPMPAKGAASTSTSEASPASTTASPEPVTREPVNAASVEASGGGSTSSSAAALAEATGSSSMAETVASAEVTAMPEEQPMALAKGSEDVVVEAPKAGWAQDSMVEPPAQAQAGTELRPEVVWEGGAPPALEGVETIAESPDHSMVAEPPSESPESEKPSQSGQDQAPGKPKRGRGRPKGSRSKKNADQTS